jgi:hypothetical protein
LTTTIAGVQVDHSSDLSSSASHFESQRLSPARRSARTSTSNRKEAGMGRLQDARISWVIFPATMKSATSFNGVHSMQTGVALFRLFG